MSSERSDKCIYSSRGKGKRTWEALLLEASEWEARLNVKAFERANRGVRFWWEFARKGEEA